MPHIIVEPREEEQTGHELETSKEADEDNKMECEKDAGNNKGNGVVQDSGEDEVSKRAKDYIQARKKELAEKGAEFKRRVKCDWLEYEAVQKKNLEQTKAK
jgi:hypothetical protein